MSLLARRVQRLEGLQPVEMKTWLMALNEYLLLGEWLAERGYSDHLAAIEAGESGPDGLEALLQEFAEHDSIKRALNRIEAALDAGDLPNEEDLRHVAEADKGNQRCR